MSDGFRYLSVWVVVGGTALLLCAGGAGCGPGARPAAVTVPAERGVVGVIDPCADRLHELSGRLLLYLGVHGEMPARLEMVTDDPGLVECPVSGEPYVYAPEGAAVAETGVLVIYDAVPVHDGRRWGVTIEAGRPFEPMSSRVVEVPEGMVDR